MPKIVPALTDSKIKSEISKHRKEVEKKMLKLSDGSGLYLLIDKNGGTSWRFDYTRPILKKRNTISIGPYPEISLAIARQYREEFRSQIAQNIDPVEQRKREAQVKKRNLISTFAAVADEFRLTEEITERTKQRNKAIWEKLYLSIGSIPVSEITALQVLDACRLYENQGKYDSAKRMRSKASQVFKYAIVLGLCQYNIADQISGILKSGTVNHYAAITDEKRLGQLLLDLSEPNLNGSIIVYYATLILPYVFVRPGELRWAEWEKIDLDKGLWAYTPPKTQNKTHLEHVVPLATQVVAHLRELYKLTGSQKYVFASMTKGKPVISESTINKRLKTFGFANGETTGHGLRATARTLLDEVLNYPIERIEMQLAHQVKDMHGRAYNRTKYLKERTEMMQAWADYLDKLREDARLERSN
ncbi:integrase arm-type DNA-binding domain-containing protein [Acinetobacter pittii]|uniref:tyrosine-type recombinase/integrase n=1 Tax=Acinetobacter TaxID=469 RepID=UPI000648257D|nr:MULTISPECIES: integrase arm-type DNA-binding domain-containing protein [Acinetobacter]MBM0876680.1 integrase arm-type DNA-binding domain-containing protein [Acinetobacter pittii]MDQ9033693.1 integrase arm-type DNA-binding domain-containing protein [Acinetobacter pittii]MDQ9078669.1 integrase arm-type DNA-binding domain-containing protein [Acinetobacter pittii]WIH75479.1 integrase arm-type DNA-binding domain-containing protein [Acinetobacter baumannii]